MRKLKGQVGLIATKDRSLLVDLPLHLGEQLFTLLRAFYRVQRVLVYAVIKLGIWSILEKVGHGRPIRLSFPSNYKLFVVVILSNIPANNALALIVIYCISSNIHNLGLRILSFYLIPSSVSYSLFQLLFHAFLRNSLN